MAEVSPEIRFTEFGLGGEGFAVRVEEITDILLVPYITPVPTVAPSIIGLFNLRGVIVALIDISSKFSLRRNPRTINSRVVVLQPKEDITFAIWVDDVWDIASVQSDSIQNAPEGVYGAPLLSGVYTRGTRAISILAPEAIARLDEYAVYK